MGFKACKQLNWELGDVRCFLNS